MSELRVFVAMPGTNLGPSAGWTDIREIETFFYGEIEKTLASRTGRVVVLQIEKKKVAPGAIHRSMYAEAFDADVYIADLTGANPNVYLELGVRWAVADHVTVLVSQSPDDVRFNVAASRYIPYAKDPGPLRTAITQVCDAVVSGLATGRVDSLVRDSQKLLTVRRDEYDALLGELAALRATRGHELLAAAQSASTNDAAIDLLAQAVAVNEQSAEIRFQLGRALRRANRLAEAESHLEAATRLRAESASAWRELGIVQSSTGRLDLAVSTLRRALDLDPRDAEAWSSLGGAYRRLALAEAPPDLPTLERSLAAYEQACRIDENDTYPLLNQARVALLMTAAAPDAEVADALRRFDDAVYLCRHRSRLARKKATDEASPERRRVAAWVTFDLAETLLFSDHDGWEKVLREAIELVDPDERRLVVSTVLGPYEQYVQFGVVDAMLRPRVERAIMMLGGGQP